MTRLLPCLCALALLVPGSAATSPRFGIEGGGGLVWIEYGAEIPDDDIDFEPRPDFNGPQRSTSISLRPGV